MTPLFRISGTRALAALLVLSLAGGPACAQSSGNTETRDLGEKMRRAFLDDPTIVRDALMSYQRFEREQEALRSARAMDSLAETLKSASSLVPFGNPDGDALVVEFSDYNCGYCKQASANLREVLKADPGVKLYVLEMPIFGPESVELARLALAAREQGKYQELHWALMSQRGRVTPEILLRVAKEKGIDTDRLKKDAKGEGVEKTLELSLSLASEFGVSGTPAFIVGNRLIPGALPKETLLDLVQQSRSKP